MDYPTTTLDKWVADRLVITKDSETELSAYYRYSGSTCKNGGTAFEARLHLAVDRGSRAVTEAWIEIPEEQRPAAAHMCAAGGSAPSFFDTLAESAPFRGKTLETALAESMPVNYAGCFCTVAMVNEKWQAALSTLRHYLS